MGNCGAVEPPNLELDAGVEQPFVVKYKCSAHGDIRTTKSCNDLTLPDVYGRNPDQLQLRYWNCQGRAQPARYALYDRKDPAKQWDDFIFPVDTGIKKIQEDGNNEYAFGFPPFDYWKHVLKPNSKITGPCQTLPCLRDGEVLINQTVAITMHAAKWAGHHDHIKDDDAAMAKVLMIVQMCYEDILLHIMNGVWDIAQPLTVFGGYYTGMSGGIVDKLQLLEKMLPGEKQFFVGKEPTAADYMVFTCFDWAKLLLGDKVWKYVVEGGSGTKLTKLISHRNMMLERPGLKEGYDAREAGITGMSSSGGESGIFEAWQGCAEAWFMGSQEEKAQMLERTAHAGWIHDDPDAGSPSPDPQAR